MIPCTCLHYFLKQKTCQIFFDLKTIYRIKHRNTSETTLPLYTHKINCSLQL